MSSPTKETRYFTPSCPTSRRFRPANAAALDPSSLTAKGLRVEEAEIGDVQSGAPVGGYIVRLSQTSSSARLLEEADTAACGIENTGLTASSSKALGPETRSEIPDEDCSVEARMLKKDIARRRQLLAICPMFELKPDDGFTVLKFPKGEFIFSGMDEVNMAKMWLEGEVEQENATYSESKHSLLINGMIKTGKTNFLMAVLPALIRQSPFFGDASNNPALIWKMDCEQFSSDSHEKFLADFYWKIMMLARESDPVLYEEMRRDNLPPTIVAAMKAGIYAALVSLAPRGIHLFLLMDEVQKFFTWLVPGSTDVLDTSVIDTMQKFFKSLCCCQDSRYLHVAISGSSMASTFRNIFDTSANGLVLSNTLYYIHLPATVEDKAMQAALEYQISRKKISAEVLHQFANFSGNNPALLSMFVDEYALGHRINDIPKYCHSKIEKKILKELWADNRYYLHVMTASQRKVLRQLVESGVDEDEMKESIFEGWREHLSPYLHRKGENVVTLDCSLSFTAFILHVIKEAGDLRWLPNERIQLDPNFLLPKFYVTMIPFSEACRRYRERLEQDKMKKVSKSKVAALMQNDKYIKKTLSKLVQIIGMTAGDLKQTDFMQLVTTWDKEGTKSAKPLGMKLVHRDKAELVLLNALCALKNALSHCFTSEGLRGITRMMAACPFDFQENASLLKVP
eukprot:m.183468 g.183468  ORF g.183468 m.183468 type:complete len:683 (+) comp39305_c0_seq40:439-2487(+)